MPLYEYKCEACDKTFEVLQKISADPLSECLHCQGKVEKLISQSSFQFKGSGWYVSDYKNKSPKSSGASKTVNAANSGAESNA